MSKDVVKNIIYTILLLIVPLFFGLVLSFLFGKLLPGDPVLAYLPPSFTEAEYMAMLHQLGLDKPLIVQFFRYVFDLFTGNLGMAGSIAPGMPIFDLLIQRILISLGFTVLPIVLGLIAGILLGVLSVKVRYKLVKVFIQILIILGISMPMFFIGLWLQYVLAFQLGIIPATGKPFLPACILFVLTLFLKTRQVRSNYLKKPEEKHILSNSLQVVTNLGFLIASILLLEVIFGIHGFFELFIDAILSYDYWLFRVCVHCSGMIGKTMFIKCFTAISNYDKKAIIPYPFFFQEINKIINKFIKIKESIIISISHMNYLIFWPIIVNHGEINNAGLEWFFPTLRDQIIKVSILKIHTKKK